MDELSAKRKRQREQNRHSNISELLRGVSTAFDTHRLESYPHAAVVVLISENGPEVYWAGYPSQEELYLAADAIKEARSAQRRGEDPHEAVEKMVERIRQYERDKEARIAERERSHPFVCSHERCTDRFKTKGALTRHERHDCRWYRYDREKGAK